MSFQGPDTKWRGAIVSAGFGLCCCGEINWCRHDIVRPCERFVGILFLCAASVCGPAAAQPSPDTIARGKALAEAADCASCHTADPAKPFAGGKRIDTPFGGIYSPNLTPDRDTGIGAWSDEDFRRALRDGVAPNGSRYYPAFPYPYFTKLTREDILAIRAYLATLAPVHSVTPAAGAALAAELSHRDAGLELSVLPARPVRAEPVQKPAMESRRLSGRGRGTLWRLPHPQEHVRRRQARSGLWRRPGAGLVCAAARRRAAQRTEIMERRRSSSNICRAAATDAAMPMARWPRSWSIRPRR